MTTRKLEWRSFDGMDWQSHAGAERFLDGSPPRIAEWEIGGLLYVAVVGPERAMVEALDDDGVQKEHLVYENPLTVSGLEYGLDGDGLRLLPGCTDLLS